MIITKQPLFVDMRTRTIENPQGDHFLKDNDSYYSLQIHNAHLKIVSPIYE